MSAPFPIAVRELESWIPHRPPMVWIDEVVWADAAEGECQVTLRDDGLYRGPNGIRPSSMIEWIAQGYAYVRAAQAMTGLNPNVVKPKRAFLVAIRDAHFACATDPGLLDGVKTLRVRARHDRELGPVSLVEGSVLTDAGIVLATVKLKLYAE